MLKISWLEFFLRGIPEEFLFVLAVHAFSKTGINLKKYLLSSTIFWVLASSIRCLPIQYGIHTILSLTVLIILANFINKIGIVKSILGGLIAIIFQFIFEAINLIFIQSILKANLTSIMNNPILKTLYGLPSIVLYGTFVVVYYLRLYKRNELKYI